MVQYFLSGISIALNQQIHKNEKHEKLWWLRGNVWQLRFLFCGHWAKMLYEIAQVCWPFAELWRQVFLFLHIFLTFFFLLFGSPQGAGGAFSLNAWETAQLGSWESRWARWAVFLWVSLHIWLLAWFSSVGQIFAPAQRVIIINNDGNFTCWKSVFRFAYYYRRPMFMFSLFRQIHQLISRACGPLLAIGHWELGTGNCMYICLLGKRRRAWRKQASNLAQPNWQLFDSICPRIDWFVSDRPLTIPQIPRFMSSYNGHMSADHFQTNYA